MDLISIGTHAAAYIAGVATPTVFKDLWERLRTREDAARIFRRGLEPAASTLRGFLGRFDRRNNILEALGPGCLEDLISRLEAEIKAWGVQRARLLGLRDDAIEKRLEAAWDSLGQLRVELFTFASPFYRANLRPDLPGDAWSRQEVNLFEESIRTHHIPIIEELLQDLAERDKHPIAQVIRKVRG